jgi:hypothetical protein
MPFYNGIMKSGTTLYVAVRDPWDDSTGKCSNTEKLSPGLKTSLGGRYLRRHNLFLRRVHFNLQHLPANYTSPVRSHGHRFPDQNFGTRFASRGVPISSPHLVGFRYAGFE